MIERQVRKMESTHTGARKGAPKRNRKKTRVRYSPDHKKGHARECDVICLYVFEDYIDSGLLSATPKRIKIRFYKRYKCAEKCLTLLLGGGQILLAPVTVELSTVVPRLRVGGTSGMLAVSHEHTWYLCHGSLKYGSGIRVPDSWHCGDSAQVVAEYNELEGRYPGRYFEVSGPALRFTTKTYKAGGKHLPGGPGVRRDQ